MKYIYIDSNNTVGAIIPAKDANFPDVPIEQRYTKEFLSQCVVVEDAVEVVSGMSYDEETKKFFMPELVLIETPEPVEEVTE